MTDSAVLDRILRRGKVEIEPTYTTVYGPMDADGVSHGENFPAVTVKWHANQALRSANVRAVVNRFKPKEKVSAWLYVGIFGRPEYVESTKPTLAEALADVYEQTSPPRRFIEDLVDEKFPAGSGGIAHND